MRSLLKVLFAGRNFPEQGGGESESLPRVRCQGGRDAYSTPELMVMIAVLGIIAAIGIGMVTGTVESSRYNTAAANLEILNSAVRQYVNAVKEFTNVPSSGISDETAVFTELKIDGSVESRPGSPYLQGNMKIVSSSDTTTYRAFWNSNEFQMLGLGTNGVGIDLLKLQ